MNKKIIIPKVCPRCKSDLVYKRATGWGTDGKWVCINCGYEEKET